MDPDDIPAGHPLWDAVYWADKLMKNREEAEELLFSDLPHRDLTVEERYKIRDLLMNYSSYSLLLHGDMPSLVAHVDRLRRPWWKKLLNRK